MSLCRRIALGLVACTSVWAAALPAHACGGLFCSRIPVDQTGEKIVFATDGREVTAHVQILYKGEAKNFSWIVPVPTPPKLDVGSDQLFAELREATSPRYELTIRDEGPCAPPHRYYEKSAAAPLGGADKRKEGVTIVSQDQVGPYDTAVLQASDASVLKAWLRKNDYVIPPKLDPLLDPYVAGKYSFVALKLTKDKAVGDIQPIVMTYKATKPGIPIRLTGVAATPDMDIWVWVLGKYRAVPQNYRHTRVNEARIDWLNAGTNYKEVVTAAVDEAGGQAFVTDYAGPSDIVPAEHFTRAHFKLDELKRATDPVVFAQAVVAGGYFGDRYGALNQAALIAFLKHYIAKPKSLAATDDLSFYRFIEQHEEALHEAGIKVDTAKAVAELEAKVVKPAEKIGTLLHNFRTLTGMYTTMSPAEMTQDPLFVFNPRLQNVAATRHADGVRRCRPGLPYWQTPVEITLSNGRRFNATPDGPPWHRRGGGRPVSELAPMPAAEVIEQLNTSGEPSLIQDNRAVIAAFLDESLRPTPSQDTSARWAAGGGLGAGLLLLGGWGWLRRQKR